MSQTCPYCRESVPPSMMAECSTCHTPHHADCWEENGGCTVFGCENAPADDPKVEVTATDVANPATYLVTRNGEQHGPFSLEALRAESAKGTFRGTDMAWTQSLRNWVPLSQILSGTVRDQIPAATLAADRGRRDSDRQDPCAGRLHFGRGLYFLSFLAAMFVGVAVTGGSARSEGLLQLVVMLIWIPVAALRARDIGMTGWTALLLFVPLANLYIGFRLWVSPRGYALTKQPDLTMKILTWSFFLMVLGFIGLMILGAMGGR